MNLDASTVTSQSVLISSWLTLMWPRMNAGMGSRCPLDISPSPYHLSLSILDPSDRDLALGTRSSLFWLSCLTHLSFF